MNQTTAHPPPIVYCLGTAVAVGAIMGMRNAHSKLVKRDTAQIKAANETDARADRSSTPPLPVIETIITEPRVVEAVDIMWGGVEGILVAVTAPVWFIHRSLSPRPAW